MRTFQTRINLTEAEASVLDQYAALCSQVERSLFVDLQKGTPAVAELKVNYLLRFGITARQFNACRASAEGKIRSLKEIQKQRIIDLQEKEKALQKKLVRKRFWGNRHRAHQRLQKIQGRLQKLLADKEAGTVRLCFGSRKLFMAQHHLENSQFASFEEWRDEWQTKRSSAFFLMGSKDETGGNQSCTGVIQEDGTLTIRLRLPDTLNQGKYLTLSDVHFKYGQAALVQALRESTVRREMKKEKNAAYTTRGVAISYRFVRDRKGWRLFASVKDPQPVYRTQPVLGYIGVDLNVDHLAVAETDHNGNLIAHTSHPLNLYGKTSNQARALIGDVVKDLVDGAIAQKKPIVIEKLDFTAKRRLLKEASPKQARMLSSFAYQRTLEAIKARAYRYGVQVFEVNPAYTSQIGKIKFAKRYGLSTHHAAAFCIARRIAGFSETLPTHTDVPDGKGAYVAFAVPVRTQQRPFWPYLREVSRKLRAALAEHFRVTECQSVVALAPT